MKDLIRAKALLEEGGYTCVLVRGDESRTSSERGIKPLMQWLESGEDCRGFQAADKVVGRATAFLYVRLGVAGIHARTMSDGALQVLERYGVPCSFDRRVDAILNRKQDGFCPMESAVREIDDPEDAFRILSEKYHSMNP